MVSSISNAFSSSRESLDKKTSCDSESTKKTGRPKGSIKKEMQDFQKRKKEAINEVLLQFESKRKSRGKSKRLGRGVLNEIISEVALECNLPSCILNPETIHSREKRNKLTPSHRGPTSPLAPVEDLAASACIQRAAMSQPLNSTDGVRLVKSLIKGAVRERELSKFHQCKYVLEGPCQMEAMISKKHWYNFKRRHKNKLKTMKGRRLDASRAKWSKHRNFKLMRNLLHDEMESCNIAAKCKKKF